MTVLCKFSYHCAIRPSPIHWFIYATVKVFYSNPKKIVLKLKFKYMLKMRYFLRKI